MTEPTSPTYTVEGRRRAAAARQAALAGDPDRYAALLAKTAALTGDLRPDLTPLPASQGGAT